MLLRSSFPLKRARPKTLARGLKTLARPLRSVLYTAASSIKHLESAKLLTGLDACLIDLEDGVAPQAKLQARENAASMVSAGGFFARTVTVRINALETPWGADDIAGLSGVPISALVVPKVESAEGVLEVAEIMAGSFDDSVELWCMIETPKGVQQVNAIAAASERTTTLVVGTSDLLRDLHGHPTPERIALQYSLSRCVVAARANYLQIVDGVHLDLMDSLGFEIACKQARNLGFDGKSLVHPNTIPIANWVFGPTASEVEEAYRVMDAIEEAYSRGEGVAVVGGRVVEKLHAENAQRVIKVHEAIVALEARQIHARFDQLTEERRRGEEGGRA